MNRQSLTTSVDVQGHGGRGGAWRSAAPTLATSLLPPAACLAAFAFAFAFAAGLAPSAFAGKPSSLPPPTGRIFARDATSFAHFAPDGTGRVGIPAATAAAPSNILHGGHRWMLRMEGYDSEINVDGSPRQDVVVQRDDGLLVRLTQDPNGRELWGGFVWTASETATQAVIVGEGRILEPDGSACVPGSGGFYAATILFDGSGNVIGLDGTPIQIAHAGDPVWEGTPNSWPVSVSPDLTRLVYDNTRYGDNTTLSVHDLDTDTVTTLVDDTVILKAPQWARSGGLISYVRNFNSVYKVNENGTGAGPVVVDTNATIYPAFWEPQGNYLVYPRRSLRQQGNPPDLYRVAKDGTGKTALNVTSDSLQGWVQP